MRRESQDCYFKARHILGHEVADYRMSLLTQVIRQLLTIIPKSRVTTLKEEPAEYKYGSTPSDD